jgi:mono/diheme cytochrome c family protein
MSRVTTLVTLGFAAMPFAIMSLQEPPKLTPLDAAKATEARTIFKGHCISCHSGENPAAKLDLSSPAGIQKGGVSGPLFVAGNPGKSLLLQRVRGLGDKPMMPFGMTALTEAQIQTLTAWIASGGRTDAPERPHWAYVKPTRPALPPVKNKAWAKNPIDRFVLARLEKEGLKPSSEATKEALIRRVTLDLIGLTPTLKEIDAFLADKQPGAYERVVDRLLASPHYGERQARPWLDLARYADTDGYEKDLTRSAWKWRDWVIKAYNQNMPFDEFTIEQLAGDQLPNPTIDQLIATGFHRNTMLNLEGGVDPEEQHFNVILDRVGTTSTVWLASTLACARCHDHKYDPLSQKDFYRMAAFFSNSAIIPKGSFETSDLTWQEPKIEVPSPTQIAQRAKLKQQIALAERATGKWTPELRTAYADWLSSATRPVAAVPFVASSAKARSATLSIQPDGSFFASGEYPKQETYTLTGAIPSSPITGLRIEAQPDDRLPRKGPGRSGGGNFVISNVTVKVDGRPAKLDQAAASFSQDMYPAKDALLGKADKGWGIAPQAGKPHELVLEFEKPVTGTTIEVTIDQLYDNHSLGRFAVSLLTDPKPTSRVLAPDLRELLKKGPSPELERAFLAMTPLLGEKRRELARSKEALAALQREIPTAMIMRDKPNPGLLQTYFRDRGEFQSKGELLAASTPGAIGPPPPARMNRLDLAKWLVNRSNPLTARVQVNRMWEMVFGRGIVETSEDFGTQSTPPSHPALLDWLATEFMARNWDMKAMNRLIVTSATYRQSSNATPALLAKDPQNVLLARGPRFRMEAEMIRDTVLAASGLLSPKVGGKSVYPYQPDGVWDTPYSSERWMESQGEDKHRRGLYTFWRRTAPYASFLALDATSREECTVRRIRTNTPLQALALLNDMGMFEAAQAMAKQMPADVDQAIVWTFRSCLARQPRKAELDRLKKLYTGLRAKYAADPDRAKKIAGTPDLAAKTMLANTILNLDETITKG